LNDQIQFGSVKFFIDQMSEKERKEQEANRSTVVQENQLINENGHHQNGKTANGGKINGLFEIQNTLDDTVAMENENENVHVENGVSVDEKNHKIYVADTDPEDNDDEEQNGQKLNNNKSPNYESANDISMDFHLEMSHSIINQSVLSSKNILNPFLNVLSLFPYLDTI
jgi:hypothetical protein